MRKDFYCVPDLPHQQESEDVACARQGEAERQDVSYRTIDVRIATTRGLTPASEDSALRTVMANTAPGKGAGPPQHLAMECEAWARSDKARKRGGRRSDLYSRVCSRAIRDLLCAVFGVQHHVVISWLVVISGCRASQEGCCCIAWTTPWLVADGRRQ